jgi:predicted metalloendopeptidase
MRSYWSRIVHCSFVLVVNSVQAKRQAGWAMRRGQGKASDRLRRLVMSFDSHSPAPVRSFIVRNSDAWVKALDVKPGDRLWLDPGDRLVIW